MIAAPTLEVEVNCPLSDPFRVLYNPPPGTNLVICIGGRGGRKTYEVSKFTAYSAAIHKKRCVILRDEKALIKETILNEILTRYDTANEDGVLDQECIRLKTGISDRKTGKELVYTKGFRASANDKKANMKGVSDIDIAVIEEAEDLVDPDKFYTFIDGLRKEGCMVIIMMNTPDIGHFLMDTYFDCTEQIAAPANLPDKVKKEYEGYYKIKPKTGMPGVVCIQTGFEDNEHLPDSIIQRYNAYGDINSHLYNLHYYLTAIKGYASTGRKGQVLKKVKPISLEAYMALPFKEYYGQDFGTAAPAGLVGVKFDKNRCYCRELNYKPMSTLDIGKMYCDLGLQPSDRIVVDYADPEYRKLRNGFKVDELSAEDLKRYPQLVSGFNVVPCIKKGINQGIDLLETMELYAVTESKNLWEEIRNRVYAQDKNGNYTNDPEPGYDHLQDGWIYVVNDNRKHRFEITTQ